MLATRRKNTEPKGDPFACDVNGKLESLTIPIRNIPPHETARPENFDA